MELLQTRLDAIQLVDFWKDIVFRTVRVRSHAADMLSLAFKRKGDLEEAVGFWKELVQRDPERVKYAELLTNAFKSMGTVASAIDFWETVLRTRPSSSKRLDIARSELAMCEVDGDPAACATWLNTVTSSRFSRSVGKAMSRPDQVQKAMQVY